MLLLAMDTSTTAITVAVHDGTRVLDRCVTLDARAHAEHLAPGIAAVLELIGATPADVTDVAVGIGPGPFTGLRVGIMTARAFGYARGIPVHGVASLDALAHEYRRSGARGDFLVATDARRKEVYWATYALGDGTPTATATPSAGPGVARAADLPPQVRELPTIGRGPLLYPDALPHGVGLLDVDAGALADLAVTRLAAGVPMTDLEPIYLRRPDALPTAARNQAPR